MKKAVIATIIFLLVLASPIIVNAASGKIFSPEEKPDLSQGTDADAVRCVEPRNGDRQATKDYMRINHQQKLKDERVRMVGRASRTNASRSSAASAATSTKIFARNAINTTAFNPGAWTRPAVVIPPKINRHHSGPRVMNRLYQRLNQG